MLKTRVLSILLGLLLSLLALPPASSVASHGPAIQVRSLGVAGSVKLRGGPPQDSIGVPDVAPAADRLVLLWVVHRADTSVGVQQIESVAGPGDPGLEWSKQFHSTPDNLTRFALFSAITGGTAPTPGPIRIRFDSESQRTNVIVLEATGSVLSGGADNAFTNLVTHEGFNNTTSRTHYLESFIDPVHNATLAFHLVGKNQDIAVEDGMTRVALASNQSNLVSAAAFEAAEEVTPTFSWSKPASNGGLALELRALGTPPERPITRRHLTQGTARATTSTTTAAIDPAPGRLLVAFVINARSEGPPDVPSLSGPETAGWSVSQTQTFDTAASPQKRLTALVAGSGSGVTGSVTISFPRAQERSAWIFFELAGVDLSDGPGSAVRQAAGEAADATTSLESTLSDFGGPHSATLAAIGFETTDGPAPDTGFTPEAGFALAMATDTRIPVGGDDLLLWNEWRASPDTTPSGALDVPADAALIALEIGAAGEPPPPPSPAVVIGDATVTERGTSTTTDAVFMVSVSPPASDPVTVGFATEDGSATAGEDYTATSGEVTIPPGGSEPIRVPVIGDDAFEPDENLFVNISAVSGIDVARDRAEGRILNDDAPPGPALWIGDTSVVEGPAGTKTTMRFPVTLSEPVATVVTFSYATRDGTATASSGDYVARSGVGKIPGGKTSGVVSITVNGDDVSESNESFFVDISNPQEATVPEEGRTGEGTIVDDDEPPPPPQPALSIGDASVTEGNADSVPASFTVSLSSPATDTVTVDYATADGSSNRDVDYTATTGTLSIAAGESSGQITVDVLGDTEHESNETFLVNLTNPRGATSPTGEEQGEGTIVDDDDEPLPPPQPALSIGDASVTEGNADSVPATFTVTLSSPAVLPVTVNHATADGSANRDVDYTATTGTLSIAAGESSGQITVPVLGDTAVEPDETFLVNLSNPQGATIPAGEEQGVGTIVNDDEPPPPPQPTLSIGDASVVEGAPGQKTWMRFPVTLSAPAATDVTFSYATRDGTATASTGGYVAKSAAAIIPAGSTFTTARIAVKGDSLHEGGESFFIDISNPQGATIPEEGRTGEGTILDDDP